MRFLMAAIAFPFPARSLPAVLAVVVAVTAAVLAYMAFTR